MPSLRPTTRGRVACRRLRLGLVFVVMFTPQNLLAYTRRSQDLKKEETCQRQRVNVDKQPLGWLQGVRSLSHRNSVLVSTVTRSAVRVAILGGVSIPTASSEHSNASPTFPSILARTLPQQVVAGSCRLVRVRKLPSATQPGLGVLDGHENSGRAPALQGL